MHWRGSFLFAPVSAIEDFHSSTSSVRDNAAMQPTGMLALSPVDSSPALRSLQGFLQRRRQQEREESMYDAPMVSPLRPTLDEDTPAIARCIRVLGDTLSPALSQFLVEKGARIQALASDLAALLHVRQGSVSGNERARTSSRDAVRDRPNRGNITCLRTPSNTVFTYGMFDADQFFFDEWEQFQVKQTEQQVLLKNALTFVSPCDKTVVSQTILQVSVWPSVIFLQ